MPQRKQTAWAQLRVGMLVIVGLTILIAGIFFISGQVAFFSSKYPLKSYFASAAGLRPGAQVRLAGLPVGNVETIGLSSYPEPQRAVEIVMRLPRSYKKQIRADSVAAVETVGLLGESYVEISRGSSGEPLPEGGVVKSREEADIKKIVQNTNDVITNLRVLSASLNDVSNQIQAGRGTLGKLIYDPALYSRMSETTASVQRLVTRVEKGEGTLGKVLGDESLYQRTVATMDHLNQVIDDVQHGKGSMAKFMNDPSVYDNVKLLVARANTLIDNVNQGQGTLGKMATDPQLYNRMNETFDRMNIITTRVEQGQGTLGLISTDPKLYNNLTESSQSLRDFLTEFKKNPKKYLSLRVRLF